MKKVLTILLIALCCVSVFADGVNISAEFSVKMSLDKDGYHFVPYANEFDEMGISFSAVGDNAGAKIKIVPTKFKNLDLDYTFWVRPFGEVDGCINSFASQFFEEGAEVPEVLEELKLTVGARPSISLKDGVDISDIASYCVLENTFNEQSNGLGFLYEPKDNTLFVAGLSNIPLSGFGVLHLDVLTKLDMEGYKPSLNYALGELTYCNSLNPSDLCAEAGYTKDSISSWFDDTENEFFNIENDWNFHNKKIRASRLVAGLRFKHYTEFAKEKENGLYGYGVFQYDNEDIGNGFYVEAEAGRNVGELRLKDSLTIEAFSGIANAIADFDWSNGNFNAKLDEVVGWASYNTNDVSTLKFKAEYLNRDANTAEENGFFVTPEVDFRIGISNCQAKVKLGLDSLHDFQWDASLYSWIDR